MSRKDTGGEAMYQLRRTLLVSRWDSIVMWVDPGESTGWAAWVFSPQHASFADLRPDRRFHAGQSPRLDACDQLFRLCQDHGDRLQLGWEDFLVTGAMPTDTSALRVIGVLEWLARRTEVTVLKPQPSSARVLATRDDKVSRLGWYRPGERDANAAAAHLLAHLMRTNQLTGDQLSMILPMGEANADR